MISCAAESCQLTAIDREFCSLTRYVFLVPVVHLALVRYFGESRFEFDVQSVRRSTQVEKMFTPFFVRRVVHEPTIRSSVGYDFKLFLLRKEIKYSKECLILEIMSIVQHRDIASGNRLVHEL